MHWFYYHQPPFLRTNPGMKQCEIVYWHHIQHHFFLLHNSEYFIPFIHHIHKANIVSTFHKSSPLLACKSENPSGLLQFLVASHVRYASCLFNKNPSFTCFQYFFGWTFNLLRDAPLKSAPWIPYHPPAFERRLANEIEIQNSIRIENQSRACLDFLFIFPKQIGNQKFHPDRKSRIPSTRFKSNEAGPLSTARLRSVACMVLLLRPLGSFQI